MQQAWRAQLQAHRIRRRSLLAIALGIRPCRSTPQKKAVASQLDRSACPTDLAVVLAVSLPRAWLHRWLHHGCESVKGLHHLMHNVDHQVPTLPWTPHAWPQKGLVRCSSLWSSSIAPAVQQLTVALQLLLQLDSVLPPISLPQESG